MAGSSKECTVGRLFPYFFHNPPPYARVHLLIVLRPEKMTFIRGSSSPRSALASQDRSLFPTCLILLWPSTLRSWVDDTSFSPPFRHFPFPPPLCRKGFGFPTTALSFREIGRPLFLPCPPPNTGCLHPHTGTRFVALFCTPDASGIPAWLADCFLPLHPTNRLKLFRHPL